MTAPPSVSIGDLERAFYLAAVPAADNNLAVTMGQGVVLATKQSALQSSTSMNAGNVTAPANGNAVVNLVIPATGYYQVDVYVGFGATAETTAIDNFIFKNNGVTMGNSICPCPNVANAQSPKYTFFVNGVSGQSLSINTGASSSAGSIYKGSIAATRIA